MLKTQEIIKSLFAQSLLQTPLVEATFNKCQRTLRRIGRVLSSDSSPIRMKKKTGG